MKGRQELNPSPPRRCGQLFLVPEKTAHQEPQNRRQAPHLHWPIPGASLFCWTELLVTLPPAPSSPTLTVGSYLMPSPMRTTPQMGRSWLLNAQSSQEWRSVILGLGCSATLSGKGWTDILSRLHRAVSKSMHCFRLFLETAWPQLLCGNKYTTAMTLATSPLPLRKDPGLSSLTRLHYT